MTDRAKIEKAGPGAGQTIARLVRRSLPARLHPLTIWGSPRAGRYVESILAGAFPNQAYEFYLLRLGSKPMGLAAFRRLGRQAFLNHLYVAPQLRGRGAGARLLETAVRSYLARRPAGKISLDVFAGARPAEAWYERLGFQERSKRIWWVGSPRRRAFLLIAPTDSAPPGWRKVAVSRRLECDARALLDRLAARLEEAA